MYLDKRKKNGLVLSYDGFKTGKEISDFCFEKLKKTKTYNVLVKKFCKNSLENYFRLYFYLNSFPHAHKIILGLIIFENFLLSQNDSQHHLLR